MRIIRNIQKKNFSEKLIILILLKKKLFKKLQFEKIVPEYFTISVNVVYESVNKCDDFVLNKKRVCGSI